MKTKFFMSVSLLCFFIYSPIIKAGGVPPIDFTKPYDVIIKGKVDKVWTDSNGNMNISCKGKKGDCVVVAGENPTQQARIRFTDENGVAHEQPIILPYNQTQGQDDEIIYIFQIQN